MCLCVCVNLHVFDNSCPYFFLRLQNIFQDSLFSDQKFVSVCVCVCVCVCLCVCVCV